MLRDENEIFTKLDGVRKPNILEEIKIRDTKIINLLSRIEELEKLPFRFKSDSETDSESESETDSESDSII